MTYLLDSNVFLFLNLAPDRVRRAVQRRLSDDEVDLAISAAAAWEIAIKQASGRLELPDDARRWVPEAMRTIRCESVPVELAHALEAASLPPHHRDPFDRVMVAQARLEGLTLVTTDQLLSAYDVKILWA